MRSWLYALSKEQLAVLAEGYGLESTGTLEDIRRRMREYADTHADEFATDPREQTGPSGAISHVVITGASPLCRDAPVDFAPPAVPDHRAINQIRKSGYHFDGRDPAAFLERLAEFRENYHIVEEQLLRGLSEL